jgi:HPt (histidine-containing phosphotransfer) domain-containing protein
MPYIVQMTSTKIIEADVLLESACGDYDTAIELLNLFFELTGAEMKRLILAVDEDDVASALGTAHKMAGSCLACGLMTLGNDLRELEKDCKQGLLPGDVTERMECITQQFGEARGILERQLDELLI